MIVLKYTLTSKMEYFSLENIIKYSFENGEKNITNFSNLFFITNQNIIKLKTEEILAPTLLKVYLVNRWQDFLNYIPQTQLILFLKSTDDIKDLFFTSNGEINKPNGLIQNIINIIEEIRISDEMKNTYSSFIEGMFLTIAFILFIIIFKPEELFGKIFFNKVIKK